MVWFSKSIKGFLEIVINDKTLILQKSSHVLKYQAMGGILCDHMGWGEGKKHVYLICNFKKLICDNFVL